MSKRLADGYEPNFDIDYEVGRQGELLVRSIQDGFRDGTVEVKNDQRALKGGLGKPPTGRVYIETMCRYGDEFLPTGVARQDGAEFVAYVLGDELIVVAPREVWHRAARAAWRDFRRDCIRGSHPTRGVAVPLTALLPLLAAALELRDEA